MFDESDEEMDRAWNEGIMFFIICVVMLSGLVVILIHLCGCTTTEVLPITKYVGIKQCPPSNCTEEGVIQWIPYK